MATFTPTRGVNFDPSAQAPSQAFGDPGPLERGLRSALTGAAADAAAREYYEASAAGDAARAQAAGLRHQNYSQQAQVEAPRVQSVGQVNGVGDAVQYGLGMLGSAPVSIVEPAAGGALGGLAASVIGSRFGFRPQMAGRALQAGGAVGAVAPMYGQFRDAAASEHYQHELQTGQRQDPNAVLSTIQERGLAQAAPYLLSPMATAPGRIAAGRSVLPQRASQLGSAVQGMALGAGADVASTMIGQSYRDTMDPTRNRSGDMTEIADEVIGGAIVGAPFEAAGHIGQGVQRAAGAAGGMALRGVQAAAEYIAPRATEAWQNRPRSMEQAAEMAGTFAADMQNRGEDAATVLAAKRFTQDADVDTLLAPQEGMGADQLMQDDAAKHTAAASFVTRLQDQSFDAPEYVRSAAAGYASGQRTQDSWKQLSDAVNDWQRSKYLEQDLNELFKGKWESGMQKVGELGADLMNAKDAAKDAYLVGRRESGRMNAQTPRVDGGWGAGLGSVSGQHEFEFGKEFELPPLTTTGSESNPERQALAEWRSAQTPSGILRSPSDRPPAEGEGLGARPSPYTTQDIEHGNTRNVPKKTDEVFRRLLVDAIVPALGLRTAGARANVGPVVAEGLQRWVQGGFSDHTGAVSAPRALLRLLPFEPVQTIAKVTDLMYRQGLIDNGVYARRNEALQKLQREIDLTSAVSTIVGERLIPTAQAQLTLTEKRDLIDELIEGRLSDSKAAAAFGNRYAEVQQDLQRLGIRSEMDYEDQLADLRLDGEGRTGVRLVDEDSDRLERNANDDRGAMTDDLNPNEVGETVKFHHYRAAYAPKDGKPGGAATPFEVGARVKNKPVNGVEVPDTEHDLVWGKRAEALQAKNNSNVRRMGYLNYLRELHGDDKDAFMAAAYELAERDGKNNDGKPLTNEQLNAKYYVLREEIKSDSGEVSNIHPDEFKYVSPRADGNVWGEAVGKNHEYGDVGHGKIWLRRADGTEFATSSMRIIKRMLAARKTEGGSGKRGLAGQYEALLQGLASMLTSKHADVNLDTDKGTGGYEGAEALQDAIGFMDKPGGRVNWATMSDVIGPSKLRPGINKSKGAVIPDNLRVWSAGATFADAAKAASAEQMGEINGYVSDREYLASKKDGADQDARDAIQKVLDAKTPAERKAVARLADNLRRKFERDEADQEIAGMTVEFNDQPVRDFTPADKAAASLAVKNASLATDLLQEGTPYTVDHLKVMRGGARTAAYASIIEGLSTVLHADLRQPLWDQVLPAMKEGRSKLIRTLQTRAASVLTALGDAQHVGKGDEKVGSDVRRVAILANGRGRFGIKNVGDMRRSKWGAQTTETESETERMSWSSKGPRSLHEDRGEKVRTNEDHTGETIGAGRSTPSNARKAIAENLAAEKAGLKPGKLGLPKSGSTIAQRTSYVMAGLRKSVPGFVADVKALDPSRQAAVVKHLSVMAVADADSQVWAGDIPKDFAAFRTRAVAALKGLGVDVAAKKGEIAKSTVAFKKGIALDADGKPKDADRSKDVEGDEDVIAARISDLGDLVAADTSKPAVPSTTPATTLAMNYKDGQDAVHIMRPEFRGKDTMDLILSGDRTATTGSLGRFNGAKKGDVVMAQGNGKQALIRFTSDPYRVERGTNEAWSKLEGWAPKVMNKYIGQYQATYELVKSSQSDGAKYNAQSDGAKYNAQSPVGRVSEAKYNAMATKLHTDLGRDGFGATHDSPIRHEGKFDWRSHQGKGEGNASFGAGTYLSTSDGVHRSYKDQFTAKTQRENGGEFSATINGKRINFGLDDEGAPDFFGHNELNHAEMGVLEWMVMENMSVSEAVQSYIYDQNKIVEKFAESSLEGFPSPEVAALIRAHKPVPKDLALAEKSLVLSRWNRRLEQTAENIAAVKDIDQKSVKLASAIDSKSPTYEVSVDIKPEQLLDWDKALSDQSHVLRALLADKNLKVNPRVFGGKEFKDLTGKDLYTALAKHFTGGEESGIDAAPAKASDYLQSIGILGHKYAASGGKNETHPNYVIYDDSKITTNYVHFNAQSAQAPTGSDPWTDAQRVKFFTDINRRLGPKIKSVLTDKLFGKDAKGKEYPISGQFLDDTITASVYATNVLQIGAHESMHALFKRLTDPGANAHRVTDILLRAANSAPVVRQLERLLDGETNALKQIAAGAEDYAEERLAYMFQFHQAGLLKIGPETKTVFQKITDTLRAVFGVLSDDQKAEQLLKAFDQGKMPDADAAVRVLERNLEWRERQYKGAYAVIKPVTSKLHRLVGTTEMNMKRHGVKEYDEIVRLFKRAVGESGAQGFFDAKDQQTKIFTNKLANVFNGLEAKDLELAAKYLHSGEKPTDKVAMDVVAKIKGGTDSKNVKHKGILPELYEYMQRKGVKVWEASEDDPEEGAWVPVRNVANYFPRVYDMEKLSTKGADFVAALLKHNGKELEAIAAETKGRTAKDVAEAILARLTNSMGEPTLEETSSAVGFSPFAAAVNKRELTWLSPEVIKEFGEKDVARVMTSYIVQAVKRAEYTERFGPDGGILKAKLESGHRTHFLQALAEKSKMGKVSRKDFDAINIHSLKVASETAKDVMAMEGTLGYDVRPMVRKLNNAAVVYQNLRTLSTSIFSQVIDPMGMVARGAEMSDAWTAYKRGLREVGASFKNENIKDKDAWIAEVVGTVDATNLLAQYGQLYGSQYMGGPFRRMNEAMFKYNGMEGFNRGMQIAGTRAAVNFIKRHSQFRSPKGDEYLAELNLKAGDVKVAESGDLNYTDPKIAAAIHQWVNGAVLRPNASQRTAWGSDPNYMAFWHMKQFAYTFHDTIIKRVVHDAKKYGDAGPAAMLVATTIPLMIGTDAMKSILLTGDEPAWMNQGLDAQLHHGAMRAGLGGMFQPELDALDGDHGLIGLAGPFAEQIAKIPDKTFGENVVNALPGANVLNRYAAP